jgi:hypothetical protein
MFSVDVAQVLVLAVGVRQVEVQEFLHTSNVSAGDLLCKFRWEGSEAFEFYDTYWVVILSQFHFSMLW